MEGMVAFWLVMGFVCGIFAQSKGYNFFGWFIFGLLLWPAALLFIAMRPDLKKQQEDDRREMDYLRARTRQMNQQQPESPADQVAAERMNCPECGESIPVIAKKCRFCNAQIVGFEPPRDEIEPEVVQPPIQPFTSIPPRQQPGPARPKVWRERD